MTKHYSGVKLHDSGITPVNLTPETIKAEPMLFRAEHAFAFKHGGWLTRRFLDEATGIWGNLDGCIIDSRHHMLMPGMYPCIPGWHTDDAPRDPNRWGGQPDIFDPEYETEHLLCIVDAGTESLTEFLIGDILFNEYAFVKALEKGQNFYKTADQRICAHENDTIQVASGQLAEFNVHSWHRGQPAKARGFRWFIRITRNSRHKVENEIRSNAQVYITDSSYGW
ncbi:hypothetical protein [Paraburkholderia susongensis]|uniref:Phytanoyl-CoA dioxygenase (PhyH) n=1 Tax=Paraburkholderia susongensis TaxID=1515439 RepID=A0A1X7KPH7_9BURK|nr:hypothetical protein [Paraburkholderia susongensis]SMG43478.1 hypothetical protein SAMN06265784_104162 [Paraburkholderia susongensis]